MERCKSKYTKRYMNYSTFYLLTQADHQHLCAPLHTGTTGSLRTCLRSSRGPSPLELRSGCARTTQQHGHTLQHLPL